MSVPKDGLYNRWAGNPNGTAERPTDCREEIPVGGRSVLFHQCSRKRGYGPDGGFCKQHAKFYERKAK